MRRLRGVATGRQQIILPLPQGELTFNLSATRRLRAVLGLPEEVIGITGNLAVAPAAFTLAATGTVEDPPQTGPSLPTFAYSEAVTATESVDEATGRVELLVTAPEHLAAYEAGEGVPGLYTFDPAAASAAPVILYPGVVEIDDPATGGTISLVHAPFAVGLGTVSIAYRVMAGSTTESTVLPYVTGEDPGTTLRVFGDVTDDNNTTSVEIGEFTLAADEAAPVLSNFEVDYDADEVLFDCDIPATVTWRRYLPGHTFVNQAEEVLAGTGAIDGASYAVESGANDDDQTLTAGITGPQELWIVARVGSGPVSNVIGGAVHMTVSGALTAPTIVGTSFGGDGASGGVAAVSVPLPPYASGNLVVLPVGIDCRASFLAGLTATGPNGEVATIRRPTGATTDIVDNEEGGNSAAAIALLYYRATSANNGGSVTISITPGGFRNLEQIICTPIVRANVKASGDPFAQVVRTFSATATATASTAALTAISAASRIEACIVNDGTLPPGLAPTGWFMRAVGLIQNPDGTQIGTQAIQTMSRDAQTTGPGQSIAAVSVPLGATPQRWVALTWELLPLGT